jgi:hypothetical protein
MMPILRAFKASAQLAAEERPRAEDAVDAEVSEKGFANLGPGCLIVLASSSAIGLQLAHA